MTTLLWNLLFFIITLGVLVTFHEYGHFWVARRNGIKVLRFSIGFGKPLLKWHDRQGTEYVLAAIPLGGYVRMLDKRVDDVAPEQADQEFTGKSVWRRIAVVAAGPAANIILAVVAFWIVFMLGIPSARPMIEDITEGSIAASAGMQPEQRILQIDGKETPDWSSVNLALVRHIGDDQLTITTGTAQGDPISHYQLDLQNWQFDPEQESPIRSLGFKPFVPKTHTDIASVESASAADKLGLKQGDHIVRINGQDIAHWQQLVSIIRQHPNEQVNIEVLRNQQQLTLTGKIAGKKQGKEMVGYLGVTPKTDPWPEAYIFEQQFGPLTALHHGLTKAWDLVDLSVAIIGKLLVGDVSVKSLSGPVSIAQGAGQSASNGLVYFLGFMALISINLGIINLLPLPVLDGGHLLYYFVELVTGRPVPERVQEVGSVIGSLMLVMLMGLALFNDFSRL